MTNYDDDDFQFMVVQVTFFFQVSSDFSHQDDDQTNGEICVVEIIEHGKIMAA